VRQHKHLHLLGSGSVYVKLRFYADINLKSLGFPVIKENKESQYIAIYEINMAF
jgi:hypothetical protein